MRRTLGPVHNEKTITQNYLQTDLYSINPESAPKVVFEVGKRNSLLINTALRLPSTSYELVSYDLPEGAEKLINRGNGVWEFVWTPSADLMPTFVAGSIRSFHVSIHVIDSTDLRAKEIIKNLAAESTIEYTLEFPKSIPEIIAIEGIAKFPEVTKLNEGDAIDLTIRVKDESSSLTQKPTLISPLATDKFLGKESVLNASRFFFIQSEAMPVKSLPHVWDFKARLDVSDLRLIQTEKEKLNLEKIMSNLYLQILGANGKISAQKMVSFEITLRQILLRPVFKIDHPELEVKSQNSNFTFTFESYLPSSVGTTLATFLSDESTKLLQVSKNDTGKSSEKPPMKCSAVSKPPLRQKCTITWMIPCSQPVGDVVIKITAAGEYNGQSSSVEFNKKLTITENKKCNPAPKEIAAAKEPKKGDKK